jgi:hypothetical protein
MIIGCSLYSFIFEMKKFKIKVESDSPYECHRSMRINKKIFIGIIGLYLLIVVPIELYVVILENKYDSQYIKDNYSIPINTSLVIRTVAKAFIEVFMFISFINLFIFFVKTKL